MTHANAHHGLFGSLALLTLLTGCPESASICPEGYRASLGRGSCVPMDAGAAEDEAADPDRGTDASPSGADAGHDAGPDSAGPRPDPDPDASAELPDAQLSDGSEPEGGVDAEATTDAEVSPTEEGGMPLADGAVHDAGKGDGGGDAPLDAGTDPGGEAGPDGQASGPICSEDDRLAWSHFHLSTSLLSTIDVCASDPRCAVGLCPMVECLHDGAGLLDCQPCVEEEVRCVFDACFDACSNDSSDAACLACACAAGCTTLFEQCTGEPLGVCNACEPAIAYCRGMHPWPALLVPILM